MVTGKRPRVAKKKLAQEVIVLGERRTYIAPPRRQMRSRRDPFAICLGQKRIRKEVS